MSITDGHQALINRLVTMSGAPNIVLPEGPGKDLPRYVVQAAGGSQRRLGASGVTEAYPEIVVRVETVKGQYTTENDALVKKLVARFSIADDEGVVTILDAPEVKAPLTGAVYAVPVIIRGLMYF